MKAKSLVQRWAESFERLKPKGAVAACVVCGKEFEKRGPAKTCGKACRAEKDRRYDRLCYQANPKKCLDRQRRTRPRMKANCVVCGKEFYMRGPKKTCGEECSIAFSRDRGVRYYAANAERIREKNRRPRKKVLCVVCGKEFEGRASAKTCGKKCGQKNSDERKRQMLNSNPRSVFCVVCGAEFGKHKNVKTCSDKCNTSRKLELRRRRRKANPLSPDAARRRRQRFAILYGSNPEKYLVRQRHYYAINPDKFKGYRRRQTAFGAAARALGLPPGIYNLVKLMDRFPLPPESPDGQDHLPG